MIAVLGAACSGSVESSQEQTDGLSGDPVAASTTDAALGRGTEGSSERANQDPGGAAIWTAEAVGFSLRTDYSCVDYNDLLKLGAFLEGLQYSELSQ